MVGGPLLMVYVVSAKDADTLLVSTPLTVVTPSYRNRGVCLDFPDGGISLVLWMCALPPQRGILTT
jgi:hypothetical protein